MRDHTEETGKTSREVSSSSEEESSATAIQEKSIAGGLWRMTVIELWTMLVVTG